jgi:tRNA(Ile)-lysidine synthase
VKNPETDPLTAALNQFWRALADRPAGFSVAISGGVDSFALAHAAAAFAETHGLTLTLLHVDHALFDDSADWADFCRAHADKLGVAFFSSRISVDIHAGFGLEGGARIARYRALAALADSARLPNELGLPLVMTAHQQDDQAETVLLRMLRGAGTRGLAAMASERIQYVDGQACYRLARPWLNVSRAEIEQYANYHQIQWREDSLNLRMQSPRNNLRRQLMPALRKIAPALNRTLVQLAAQARADRDLIAGFTEKALARCLTLDPNVLNLRLLRAEPAGLHIHMVQSWLSERASLYFPGNTLPDAAAARALVLAMAACASGEMPIAIHHYLHRYRDLLYFARKSSDAENQARAEFSQLWDLQTPLRLPGGDQLFAIFPAGVAPPNIVLSVRFRAGETVLRPAGRGLSKSLKTLFQEQAIPPFLRNRLPLVTLAPHSDAEIDAVVGVAMSQRLVDALGSCQLRFEEAN